MGSASIPVSSSSPNLSIEQRFAKISELTPIEPTMEPEALPSPVAPTNANFKSVSFN